MEFATEMIIKTSLCERELRRCRYASSGWREARRTWTSRRLATLRFFLMCSPVVVWVVGDGRGVVGMGGGVLILESRARQTLSRSEREV